MANSKQNEDKITIAGMSLGKFLIVLFLGITVVTMIFSCMYTISAGERGVMLTFGKADPVVKTEGLHFKYPFVQKVIKMEIRTLKYEAAASAASKDLQVVSATITTNYHLVAERVPEIYSLLGIGYADRVIQPMEQEVVKATTARFTAEELITKREEVRQEIKNLFTDRLIERGIIVEEVSIVNFDFSPSFNNAIEAKVTAEQTALAAKNKLEQVKFEALQKIEEAKGKAEAITIEGNALRANQQIIQLKFLEKWDGKLSLVTGGATPLINMEQFTTSIANSTEANQ